MAINAITDLNPENWVPMVQDFLNNKLVSKRIANVRFKRMLTAGDQINWPQLADVRVQGYTPGTDLTIDALSSTQSSMSIDQSRAVTFPVDPTDRAQALDKGFAAKMAMQAGFQLANEIDQNLIKEGTDNANSGNDITGGTLSTANFFEKITDAMAALTRANGDDGEVFAIVDPERRALLTQIFTQNGFDEADVALRNGFIGKAAGFTFFVSNNIPVSQSITIATQPTNTDTVVLFGVTFTYVTTIGTTAGNVLIGANAAAAQANLRTLINTPETTTATGVALSTDNQRTLQNAQASMAAFAANVGALTGFGKIGGTETFTDGTDSWGTETGSLLFGRRGALSLGMQLEPNLFIRPEPKQIQDNYITHTLYGKKIFTRDAFRLSKMTYNL